MKFNYCRPVAAFLFFAIGVSATALAQPGAGIKLGEATSLSPSVLISYNYDDNVNLRRRATGEDLDEARTLDENTSDTFYRYLFSLPLTRFVGNRQFRANVWYGQEYYQEFSDLDGENYGISGGYFWARPGRRTTLDITALYEHAVDRAGSADDGIEGTTNVLRSFETVSERVERDIYSASAVLDQKVGSDLGTEFSFAYYDTQYVDPLYNDRTNYTFALELNHQLTPKTQPYGTIGYGLDDDEGFVDSAEKPYFLLGGRYSVTNKTRLDLGVGYERYTRTPYLSTFTRDADGNIVETREEGEEQTDSNLKYQLSLFYRATTKTTFRLSGRNGYDSVASSTARSRQENAVSLSAHHTTTPTVTQSLIFSWREDDYLSPITRDEVEYDEVKETLRGQYRLNYATRQPWLSLFGSVSYEVGESNLPGEDYDQTIVSLGATLRY